MENLSTYPYITAETSSTPSLNLKDGLDKTAPAVSPTILRLSSSTKTALQKLYNTKELAKIIGDVGLEPLSPLLNIGNCTRGMMTSLSISQLLQDLIYSERTYIQELTTIYSLYLDKNCQQRVAVGNLIDAHHQIPTNLLPLIQWAIDIKYSYEVYVECYSYNADYSSDFIRLQERPLVRIRYFSELFESLYEKSPDIPLLDMISKEYKKIAELAHKKVQDKRERVDKGMINFSRVKNFTTLLPDSDYFNQNRIIDRDYFDTNLIHESGYTWSSLVTEVILLKPEVTDEQRTATEIKPSIAICSLEHHDMSLIFPVFRPGELLIKSRYLNTVIRLSSFSGKTVITFKCTDKEQIRKWKGILSELFSTPEILEQAITNKASELGHKRVESFIKFGSPVPESPEESYLLAHQPAKSCQYNPNIPIVDSAGNSMISRVSYLNNENLTSLYKEPLGKPNNEILTKETFDREDELSMKPGANETSSKPRESGDHFHMDRSVLPPLLPPAPLNELYLPLNHNKIFSDEESIHDENQRKITDNDLNLNVNNPEPVSVTKREYIKEYNPAVFNHVLGDAPSEMYREAPFEDILKEKIFVDKIPLDFSANLSHSDGSHVLIRKNSTEDVKSSNSLDSIQPGTIKSYINKEEVIELPPSLPEVVTSEISKLQILKKGEYILSGFQGANDDQGLITSNHWDILENPATTKPRAIPVPNIVLNKNSRKNSVKKLLNKSNTFFRQVSGKIHTNIPGKATRSLQKQEVPEFIDTPISAQNNCQNEEKSGRNYDLPIQGLTGEAPIQTIKPKPPLLSESYQPKNPISSHLGHLTYEPFDFEQPQLTSTSIPILSDDTNATACITFSTPVAPITPPLLWNDSASSSILLDDREIDRLKFNRLSIISQNSFYHERDFRASPPLSEQGEGTTTEYDQVDIDEKYKCREITYPNEHRANLNNITPIRPSDMINNSPEKAATILQSPNFRQVPPNSSSKLTVVKGHEIKSEMANDDETLLEKALLPLDKISSSVSRKRVSFQNHIIVYDDGLSNFSRNNQIVYISEWNGDQWRRLSDSDGATLVTSVCGEGGQLEIVSESVHTSDFRDQDDDDDDDDEDDDDDDDDDDNDNENENLGSHDEFNDDSPTTKGDFNNITEPPYSSKTFGRTLGIFDLKAETIVRRANAIDVQVQLKHMYMLMIRTRSANEADALIRNISDCCRNKNETQLKGDNICENGKKPIPAKLGGDNNRSSKILSFNGLKSAVMATFATPLTSELLQGAIPLEKPSLSMTITEQISNKPRKPEQLKCKLFVNYAGANKWFNLGRGHISVFTQVSSPSKRVLLSKTSVMKHNNNDNLKKEEDITESESMEKFTFGEVIYEGTVGVGNFKKCGKMKIEFYFDDLNHHQHEKETDVTLSEINNEENSKNWSETTDSCIYMIYTYTEEEADYVLELLQS